MSRTARSARRFALALVALAALALLRALGPAVEPAFAHHVDLALVHAQRLNADDRGEAAAVAYTIADRGTLGGPPSRALNISRLGQVVGGATTAADQVLFQAGTHAFLWDDGRMTDLGTLGGAFSSSTGVNNRGQMVGSALT